jgi:polysaccharide pyruvyl transferase WcaK-like protein
MQAILVGNYGVGNLGDEALRLAVVAAHPEVDWTVLSANPGLGELPRLPAGPRSLFLTPWWRTLKAIREADAVVFGGGSLFTDIESPFACFLWWLHVVAANLFHVPVILAFQGIGPFSTAIGERFARSAVGKAASVSVRDRQSEARVRSWFLNNNVVQSFDPVFCLFLDKKRPVEQKNVLTLIPRHNTSSSFVESARKIAESNDFDLLEILLLQGKETGEKDMAERLSSEIGLPARIRTLTTLEELCAAISGSRMVVSQRYHGALAALATGVALRIIAQDEDDKLSSLRPGSGLPIEDMGALKALVQAGHDELRTALRRNRRFVR